MKNAFLLFALIFAGCDNGTSPDGSSSKIVDHYTVGYEIVTGSVTVQVAKEDFPKDMSWDDARSSCEKFGNGWRLPTLEELVAMSWQLHLNGKGNFKTNRYYWSSEENDAFSAFYFSFDNGRAYCNNYTNRKSHRKPVRAVRDLH